MSLTCIYKVKNVIYVYTYDTKIETQTRSPF